MQFADVACALKTQTAIEDGQAVCPSFFVYWGCAKETKFFCNSVKRQKSHKELRLLLHCVTMSREGE